MGYIIASYEVWSGYSIYLINKTVKLPSDISNLPKHTDGSWGKNQQSYSPPYGVCSKVEHGHQKVAMDYQELQPEYYWCLSSPLACQKICNMNSCIRISWSSNNFSEEYLLTKRNIFCPSLFHGPFMKVADWNKNLKVLFNTQSTKTWI
jgi:hypothetical protein